MRGLTAEEARIKDLERENAILRLVADDAVRKFWDHIDFPGNNALSRRNRIKAMYDHFKELLSYKIGP